MKLIFNLFVIILAFWSTACNNEGQNFNIPPLPGAPSALGSKENPNARAEYERRLLADPKTNQIPSNIHRKELAFVKSIKQSGQSNLRTQTENWSLAGPANVGGRTRALALDVRDSEIILAGGVSGGMWRSENGGQNWSRASQPSSINSVTCVTQDTRIGKRDTWYFGTGELDGNSARASGAPYRGDGIFKSTDGGASWGQLPSTASNQPASFDSPFNYIWNIAISPTQAFEDDIVYAAIYGNIVRSVDGGDTWEKVLGEPNLLENMSGDLNDSNASFYTNLMITPSGKMFAYLSTYAPDTNDNLSHNFENKGIFSSEDGNTWQNITPPGFNFISERLVMSYAPSEENIVYFLAEGSSIQLWKYDNGTWSNRSNQIPDENSNLEAYDSQGSYNMTIKIHPDDSDVVFIGGTNLYRSSDGFISQTNTSQIGGYDLEDENELYANHHPDQHEIVFLPSEGEMLTANDGGIFKTFNNLDQSVSWVSLNNGYVTSQFYTVAVSKNLGGNEIIGGLQDNGSYLKSQGGENPNWSSVLGGDGSYCASTPDNRFWYMSFQRASIFKISYAADGSIATWAKVDPKGITRENYLFISPFVLDPNNYNRMYLAGDSAIWRNDNLSQIELFQQITTSTNWNVIEPVGQSQKISALDISTNPAHVLYYGTIFGNVYKISSANLPTPETNQIFSHNGYVSNICVDPSDAERLLVCYSNYNITSLYLSENGGQSFIDVGGNLEENVDGSGNGPSIRWSQIIPIDGGGYKYFVGTSMGLFSSELLENGTTWRQEGTESIGNSVVNMIDYRSSDGKIAIGTHGNGVFESTLASTTEITSDAQQQEGVALALGYPNPFTDEFHIRFTLPELNPTAIFITDVSGRIIRTLLNTPQFEGDITATWDGKNDSGNQVQNGLYQYLIIYQGNTYSGKMLLKK